MLNIDYLNTTVYCAVALYVAGFSAQYCLVEATKLLLRDAHYFCIKKIKLPCVFRLGTEL